MATITHFLGRAVSTSNLTTYDFGNFTPGQDGIMFVVVTFTGLTARTVSDITIGGVSVGASLAAAASSTRKVAVGWKTVTAAGGAKDVQVVLSGSNGLSSNANVHVYLVEGVTSVGTAVFLDDTSTAAPAVQFTVPANGSALYGLILSATHDKTWSNASEDFDSTTQTGSAHIDTSSALSSHTETATLTNPSSNSSAGMVGIPLFGATVYDAALGVASYTVTAMALGQRFALSANLAKATFTLTGKALVPNVVLHPLLPTSSYTFTGKSLSVTRAAPLDTATFVLTGQAIVPGVLQPLILGKGTFTLTLYAPSRVLGIGLGTGIFTLTANDLRVFFEKGFLHPTKVRTRLLPTLTKIRARDPSLTEERQV